jgi:hypothetical protein
MNYGVLYYLVWLENGGETLIFLFFFKNNNTDHQKFGVLDRLP